MLLGCKGKAKVTATPSMIGDSVELKLEIDPPGTGEVRLKGHPAFEKVSPVKVSPGGPNKVDVPGVPIGKHAITVDYVGAGRGLAKTVEGHTTVTVDRVAVAATLRVKAQPRGGSIDVTCRGELCGSGTSTRLPLGSDAKLSLLLTDCDGCTVEIAGQRAAVRGAQSAALFDLTPAVVAMPPSAMRSIADMQVPVKVTSKEGAVTQANLEMLGTLVGGTVLRRVAQGPLALPGDTPPPAKPRGAAIVRREPEYGTVTTVGSATRIGDLDLVGVATGIEQNLGSCGVYEKSTTKEKVNVVHKGVSFDITLYERRSGRTLGRRTFRPANTACGDKLTSDQVTNLPVDAEIEAWAMGFLR